MLYLNLFMQIMVLKKCHILFDWKCGFGHTSDFFMRKYFILFTSTSLCLLSDLLWGLCAQSWECTWDRKTLVPETKTQSCTYAIMWQSLTTILSTSWHPAILWVVYLFLYKIIIVLLYYFIEKIFSTSTTCIMHLLTPYSREQNPSVIVDIPVTELFACFYYLCLFL